MKFRYQAIFLAILLIVLPISVCMANSIYYKGHGDNTYPATPEKVVEAYCSLDLIGIGTNSSTWPDIQRLTTWLDGPGWDFVIIVDGYNIVEATIYDNGAAVIVKYNIVGEMESEERGFKLKNIGSTEIVKFNLVKSGALWKIKSPQNAPHISVEHAIADLENIIANSKDATEITNNKRVAYSLKKYINRNKKFKIK